MTAIKRLAGQTAIYGIPGILGRILTFLLNPLYTAIFLPGKLGIVSVFYAYASFLKVVLTYGMETTFFRFNEQEKEKEKVFSTGMISLLFTTGIFIITISLFSGTLARWIDYADNSNYIIWFGWILALDSLSSIPFARLRAQNKAKRFAIINMTGIITNIGLNLFFILLCPYILGHYGESIIADGIRIIYRSDWSIEYIFISNLISSSITLLLLLPGIVTTKWETDKLLWKKMLLYTFPLLFAGMAGIINETFDRIMLRYLLPGSSEQATYQVGIYGAIYKISILMTIFIQAYKYAAEPFFFSQAKEKDAKILYARIMDYFIIVVSLIFLVTMVYLDDFVLPILVLNKEYWIGKDIVPVLMMANLFLGVYYNLSIWYKLTGKTSWGAWFSVIGAIITLVLNFIWIPLSADHYIAGYHGSAWATFICYGAMMVISYLVGQRYFPIKYNLKKFGGYLGLSVLLYFASVFIRPDSFIVRTGFSTLLIVIFLSVVYLVEKPDLSFLKRKTV